MRRKNTVKPHYNDREIWLKGKFFIITRPCRGSQIDYFAMCLKKVTSLFHGSLITRSASKDPKDCIIMRLTCKVKLAVELSIFKWLNHFTFGTCTFSRQIIFC